MAALKRRELSSVRACTVKASLSRGRNCRARREKSMTWEKCFAFSYKDTICA